MIDSGSRPPKKPRLLDFVRPFVPTGAIATSRSSAVEDDECLARLRLDDVDNDDLFFPNGVTVTEDPATIAISQKAQRALTKKNIAEETLRNAIYTDLMLNHGIQFPLSSKRWRSEMALRSRLSFSHRYNETDLAHLLGEFYVEQLRGYSSKEENAHKLLFERILLGLDVTTTSKPDMTVVRGKSLYFGEFKNSDKYSEENAGKQCALYLYALLYFFRVRLGMKVKAVFGFFVCGSACFGGRDIYSVGFVRLSAPDNLGSPIVPQVFSRAYPTNDVSGIQRLVLFLKSGKEIEWGGPEEAIPQDRCIPALLTLPAALWESPLLVRNGTSSMVFKGRPQDILGLLDQFSPRATLNYPGVFRPSVNTFFEQKDPGSSYYLKIMLKDTRLREYPSSALAVIQENAEDVFNEVYCVTPAGDKDFGMFLMNDCGTTLHESREFAQLTFPVFRDMYRRLWKKSISMCRYYLHGDALPHNMVYNKCTQQLVLIDLDEGTHGIKAPKRVIREDEGHAYPYLRYPNFLRAWKNRELYTQLQFATTLLQITGELFASQLTEEDRRLISRLEEMAAAANSFLRDSNDDDPALARDTSIDNSVKQLIARLQEFLQPQAST